MESGGSIMSEVRIWEETVRIPTYEPGEADKNPMFLDKRVYQGSSGKIYPYPTIEKISDEKKELPYQAVFLENEYIKVMVLPQLGGRIQRAYDKTNGYDFVYYNHVIKPALVGLTGPWISGGIEFNWPQHHRPTTFLPVDYELKENKDGSRSLYLNDVDQMYGTKGIMIFTLYPGKSYIEIKGQLYNPTPLPQTFLWWANPAVAVNDNTQSVFPPDVHAVMDHGKRDVSRFPVATGVYYKHDYSEGVDISRYKNIPVPTSYMAEKSDYDFVGGYDYGKKAGILHVADHHISPGKKQWTWGCGDFGKAWDRNLTDEDGPYIELMTGVYTDNQPDFTWLKPFEEKTFTQYFMPYKEVGQVKNASIDAVLGAEFIDGAVNICVYSPRVAEKACVRVVIRGKMVLEETVRLSPNDIYRRQVPIGDAEEDEVKIQVLEKGRILTGYQPAKKTIEPLPEPASAAKDPKEIGTNEELYLTGLHIEQYRHATYLPDPYYLEGLKRDPGDIRINNAYGTLLLRRGQFEKAEPYFRAAIRRATWKNPNPYDSEPYYNLGLCLLYQGRKKEAFDAFYKAVWSGQQQEMGFYYLAAISAQNGEYEEALEFIQRSLVKNSHHIKARGLKAYLLRKLGFAEEASEWRRESLCIDGFDYVTWFESWQAEGKESVITQMKQLMRGFEGNYLMTARSYGEWGAYHEAIELLELFGKVAGETPMTAYYQAYYQSCLAEEKAQEGAGQKAKEACIRGAAASSDYCFPNKLEDIAVLKNAMAVNPEDAKAPYYLGCLYYDRLQYDEAVRLWEVSARLDSSFATVWRNLSLAYFNKEGKKEEALTAMERAYACDPSDARVFFERDQLYMKFNKTPEERKKVYESACEVFEKRDDLVIEYASILNQLAQYEEALKVLSSRRFHPWEGGEGKATGQYTAALVGLALQAMKAEKWEKAREYLQCALVYPENLGEGKLEGTKDNHIYYYMGCVEERLGNRKEAENCWKMACDGTDEPAGMLYYNDQPADMILYQGLAWKKLGHTREANARFYRLIDYGEQHLNDEMRISYFAVSLPDFVVFDDDLNRKNRVHCYFLMGLGKMGLGEKKEALADFEQALMQNPIDPRVNRYKALLTDE